MTSLNIVFTQLKWNSILPSFIGDRIVIVCYDDRYEWKGAKQVLWEIQFNKGLSKDTGGMFYSSYSKMS